MVNWKRSLWLLVSCQLINFAAFTMMVPVLPLYVMELGVTDPNWVPIWVGVVAAANWVTAAIGSPFWGVLADRYGKKPMLLRAAFGLSFAVTLLGLVQNVWQLAGVRLLQGAMVGFGTAATALVASQAPRDRVGFAAGLMQTASVAGTVIGPVLGGVLAHAFAAVRPIFLVVAGAVAGTGMLVLVGVREERPQPVPQEAARRESPFSLLAASPVLAAMTAVTFVTMLAIQTVDPVLPLYVRHMEVDPARVPLVAGLLLSATGLANVMTAPFLGRLGDRLGPRPVLLAAMAGAALTYALQALVRTPAAFFVVRLLLGMSLGGILPTANAAISRALSLSQQGRGFGLAMSANHLGSVFGPLLGGLLVAGVGQRAVFLVAAALLFLAAWWVRRHPAGLSAGPPGDLSGSMPGIEQQQAKGAGGP